MAWVHTSQKATFCSRVTWRRRAHRCRACHLPISLKNSSPLSQTHPPEAPTNAARTDTASIIIDCTSWGIVEIDMGGLSYSLTWEYDGLGEAAHHRIHLQERSKLIRSSVQHFMEQTGVSLLVWFQYIQNYFGTLIRLLLDTTRHTMGRSLSIHQPGGDISFQSHAGPKSE
jgi:hypothetical protein